MTLKSTNRDVLIVGAGAAGLMCASEAAKRGKRVAVLEHNSKPGKKIRISGGGRCNFTNLYAEAENFVSQNPHFCKSALAQYTQYDFLDLVERHAIPFHERLHGQLFCNDSAQNIIDMLCFECTDSGGEIVLDCKVESVEKRGNLFVVGTSLGEWTCQSLVIASGGLSIPKIGATGFGYQVAEQFGLNVISTSPALVPFTWNSKDKDIFSELSGISFAAEVSCGSFSYQEQLLLTHRGMSGPVILQVSLHWAPGQPISINVLPEVQVENEVRELVSQGKKLNPWLRQHLPKRFLKAWGSDRIPVVPLNQMSHGKRDELVQSLTNWTVMPNGTEGYRTAEVTAGGVDTHALSSRTMESRDVPGLFFIGEVVDVTGWLGGFNFQWAWSSGFVAGQSV